jgi:hypothetical protein
MTVFQRFAKMTPTTGTQYNANALVTPKYAQQTTSGTFLHANAFAMDLLFNGMMLLSKPFSDALVVSCGTKIAAHVNLAKTKVCSEKMNSSTHKPANACACQFAAKMDKPLITVNANALLRILHVYQQIRLVLSFKATNPYYSEQYTILTVKVS